MKSQIEISYKYEEAMEHSKWMKEIPFIEFPAGFKVKFSPPFAGAVVRFIVQKKDVSVSVYLDCYNNLGYESKPYWEVYPSFDGGTFRCYIHETDKLVSNIVEYLNSITCSQ